MSQSRAIVVSFGRWAKTRHRLLMLVLLVGGLLMLFPFIWMAATACKPASELNQVGLHLLPEDWSCVDNLRALGEAQPEFARYMGNTAVVTVFRVAGQFLLTTLAAYGFARFEFPFKNVIFVTILAILMVPYQALVIPQFIVVRQLGLFATLPGIFLPNVASAFSLFLFRQAFSQVPIDMEEAAMVDGASTLRILYRVVLPVVRPAVNAFLILNIIAAWNDFLWPLVIANTPATRVVTVGISLLQSRTQSGNPFNLVMLSSLISILPLVIAFLALQRRFIEGLAAQGVKG